MNCLNLWNGKHAKTSSREILFLSFTKVESTRVEIEFSQGGKDLSLKQISINKDVDVVQKELNHKESTGNKNAWLQSMGILVQSSKDKDTCLGTTIEL